MRLLENVFESVFKSIASAIYLCQEKLTHKKAPIIKISGQLFTATLKEFSQVPCHPLTIEITTISSSTFLTCVHHSSTYVGFEEYFKDNSDGAIASWIWEFGDGSMSYEQSPRHSYVYTGTYTVRLTVSGPGGTDFVEKTITVE